MNKFDKDIISNLRKYAPFGGIILLTVALMFIFKYNKSGINKLLDEGKSGIQNLYAENLKPLFTKTDLTNNDVFDFAVNQKLPIDKEHDEYLKVSELAQGDKTFEIKKGKDTDGDKTYDAYVNALSLNDRQKAELDSILNSYKEDLYVSVLYNDDKTIAINPNLALLQEALQQDLYNYSKALVSSVEKITPTNFDIEGVGINFKNVIESTKNDDQANLIFFTPDTIFNTDCKIDKKKLQRDLEKHNWKMENKETAAIVKIKLEQAAKKQKEAQRTIAEAIKVQKEANTMKVVIPKNAFANIIVKEIPELKNNIEEIKELKINFDEGKLHKMIEVSIAAAAAEAAKVGVQVGAIQKAMDLENFNFDFQDTKKWEEFGEKMDSLSQIWEAEFNKEKKLLKKNEIIKSDSTGNNDSTKVSSGKK